MFKLLHLLANKGSKGGSDENNMRSIVKFLITRIEIGEKVFILLEGVNIVCHDL